jgi:predicted NUDIX family NTP pyrophosphohydrolase
MDNFKDYYMLEERKKDKVPVTAGILLFTKSKKGNLKKIFLITPGGPKWEGKYHWGIPKGRLEDGEDIFKAAKREFEEETGFKVPKGKKISLGSVVRHGKYPKVVFAIAIEGSGDEKWKKSNKFKMEWPPGSGKVGKYPEIREGRWFDLADAQKVMSAMQQTFLTRLMDELK